MVRFTFTPYLSAFVLFVPSSADAEILRVGPDQRFGLPSHAAAVAQDGDTVEIAGGEYRGDVAVWTQDNLTLRGLGTGAHLRADGVSAEGKGIWVITGRDVLVENLEFSGAQVPDRNGAGIRHLGTNLTIRNCHFHNNENGILASKGTGNITIENSVFNNNGHGDGLSHNIYVGQIDSLTITASYFHHAYIGHNIKSRARVTRISYSKIMDGADGQSSYLVDIPNGGNAILIGNILQQGPQAENGTLVAYSAEARNSKFGELFLINNTLINDRRAGLFLKVSTPYARVHVQNNIFLGRGKVSDREFRDISNFIAEKDTSWLGRPIVFVNRSGFDFRLMRGSPAIDSGIDPMDVGLVDAERPLFEYKETAKLAERPAIGQLDIGAFEYVGE